MRSEQPPTGVNPKARAVPVAPALTRLVNAWTALAGRALCAEAHSAPDSLVLTHQLVRVEEEIERRYPTAFAQLSAELLAWEATYAHVGDGPVEACLVCRRAALDLPVNLPLPVRPSPGGAAA